MIAPYACPTPCDEDCELNGWGCHEAHTEAKRQDHDPAGCEARMLAGMLRWLVDAGWMVTVARYREPRDTLQPFYARLVAHDRDMRVWTGVSPGDVLNQALEFSRKEGFTP